MATATAPPTTPKTTTSVDPLYTQALAQAKAALAGETAPIANEQATSDAQYATRETDATNVAAALSKLLQPIGPAVNDMYQTAAQNQELAAKGFSQGMQDALQGNTDNLNAMLKSLGQNVQLDSHAPQAGDMLYSIGGYNPGTAFSKEGAAFGSAATLQAGDAILKGQENVKDLQAKAIVADQGFQQKIAELAGKLPGDIQTNYSKLQSLALSNAKFREQVAHDKATEALATAKYKTSVAEFNARQTMTAAKFAYQQQHDNAQLAAEWARIGISQRSLQLRISQNAFKAAHGGYSASQMKSFTQKLDAIQASTNPTRPVNGVMPGPQYQDAKGVWHDITPGLKVPKGANIRGLATYSGFITQALKKGVPIQYAIARANTIFPETQRTLSPALAGLPAAAAQAAQATADHNLTTGVTLGTSPNGTPITWSAPKNLSASGKRAVQGILNLTSEYLGTPYAWGGESPTGFDCSGLAQYVYAKEGIQIPRTTYDQFQSGLSVPRGQLQAGDLVFFNGSDAKTVNGVTLPGHVGIYIGGGKFVEAPHTGDVVKISNLAGYPGYMGARRYVH